MRAIFKQHRRIPSVKSWPKSSNHGRCRILHKTLNSPSIYTQTSFKPPWNFNPAWIQHSSLLQSSSQGNMHKSHLNSLFKHHATTWSIQTLTSHTPSSYMQGGHNKLGRHPSHLKKFGFLVLAPISVMHHTWDFRCVLNVFVYNKVYKLCTSCAKSCILFCMDIYLSTLILSEGPSPSNFRSPNKLIEGSFRVVVPYPCMLISHIHLNMSPTLVGTHIQFTSINKRYVTLLWVQFPTPNNHGCWIGWSYHLVKLLVVNHKNSIQVRELALRYKNCR